MEKALIEFIQNSNKVQYNNTKKGNNYFKGKYVNKLLEDAKGNIWISTYQNGIWVYKPNLKKFSKVQLDYSDEKYTINVGVLFKDSKNRIWTTFNGELDSSKRVYVFSDEQKLLGSFSYNSQGLLGKSLNDITEDEFGRLWFAVSKGGLVEFIESKKDLNNSNFIRHNFILDGKDFFNSHDIKTVVPDYDGNLFMITTSGSLLKYNLKTNEFVSFLNNPNFKELRITSILLENKNNLWFGSTNGIHNYGTEKDILTTYTSADGFQNSSFKVGSTYKDSEGLLYFGGDFGVNSFLPTQMYKDTQKVKLYINDIEILNKPASTIIPKQFNKRVEEIKNIELSSNQSSFTFWFSAISNTLNSDYYYSYKLNGFDEEWIIPKQEGVASYTNIPHGHYTFEVKAGSKKNIWDIEDSISLNLLIKPPWWLSTGAYISYLILLILIIYGLYTWYHLRNKLHKEELKYNSEKELYALKMNFFAKMSHEIQTPLTLISGPISDMLNRASLNGNELLKNRLVMIKNNANRLSRIAFELMSLRNKELEKLRIYASKNNLAEHLSIIAASFAEQAKFKNINFIQEFPSTELNIWYDIDKIEHVFYNLLSNAFKFTPQNGTITLKVVLHTSRKQVEILVIDTGFGIPKNELDDVFKFLYQSDLGKHTRGTGIGLALAKELILLHHGSIDLESFPEKGTRFSIKLSTDENLFTADDKINIEDSKLLTENSETDIKMLDEEPLLTKTTDKKYKILIVEDNVDMQIFLRDVLSYNFEVLVAANGQEGINFTKQNNPDLIISDIMMPIMDGIEMCKTINNNRHTSHIPIILLTAKNTSKERILGLKSGAVEYLGKPFNVNELLLKVNNIISTKINALNKFKTDQHSVSKENDGIISRDDIFIESLTKELNNQIYNPDFKLENLSKAMIMSYSVIYRKCCEITDKTPVEYFRKLRLNKAAILILKKNHNISEAAYMVGYKDSKYFSKCFKEEFGKTPAAIKNEAKKTDIDSIIEKYHF